MRTRALMAPITGKCNANLLKNLYKKHFSRWIFLLNFLWTLEPKILLYLVSDVHLFFILRSDYKATETAYLEITVTLLSCNFVRMKRFCHFISQFAVCRRQQAKMYCIVLTALICVCSNEITLHKVVIYMAFGLVD